MGLIPLSASPSLSQKPSLIFALFFFDYAFDPAASSLFDVIYTKEPEMQQDFVFLSNVSQITAMTDP